MALRLVLLALVAFASDPTSAAQSHTQTTIVEPTGGHAIEAQSAALPIAADAPPIRDLQSPKTEKQETTVYVTRTGKKYHRDRCRYLARSRIPMSLKEAATTYGPCSVCRPPTLERNTETVTLPPAVSTPPKADPPKATSSRCQAITKKGTQCSRRAKAGSRFCWQHGG